ncbi:MAG: sporulation protein [Ruminococcaceae bacterium]|nr:sporulation protein [Oscillospiraceae bacterium]
MDYMETPKTERKHSLTLSERKTLTLTGIEDVISFDENGILLLTSEGTLTVDGTDIHIVTLCVESGELSVEGRICGLYYVDKTTKKSGFFARKNER